MIYNLINLSQFVEYILKTIKNIINFKIASWFNCSKNEQKKFVLKIHEVFIII